ncbi:MAG: MBL fold metallo-hydrolase [Rhodospirillaceae bacterium]|nr:MBL fold metallo-hydrolase [Rhodospirillaceae bacterium]
MISNMLTRMTIVLTVVVAGQPMLRAQPGFPTAEAMAASETAQQHIAAATALAGSDLIDAANAYCSPTGPRRPALVRQDEGLPPVEDYLIEPTRIFENLSYIGFNDVGAWAIETSEGLILIDTLNSPDEARDVLVPGLEKLGLDPAQIEYIVIGHGHNDHVGGASYLQATYGARILISGPDWDLALSGERPDRPRPTRDMVVTDGQEVTLGDTTVTLALTPGHTAGTIAMLIPVRHLGRTHTVVLFSGTEMPTQESLAVFEHVFDDIARPLRAESALSGHPGILMNTPEIQEQLRQRYPDGPHPLLLGPERFDRYLSIMLECNRARLAAME